MIILGIDPGTATTGYGILQIVDHKPICLNYGVIKTAPHQPLGQRLVEINNDLEIILTKYQPTHVGIEQLFFFRNVTNALDVAQARGVILQNIYQKNIPCFEFTPLQIKQAMTGYGRASKVMMQTAISQWLKLEQIPKPDDAADGLAIALTTFHSLKNY